MPELKNGPLAHNQHDGHPRTTLVHQKIKKSKNGTKKQRIRDASRLVADTLT